MDNKDLLGILTDWEDDLEEISKATVEVAAVFEDSEEEDKLERMTSVAMGLATQRLSTLIRSVRNVKDLLREPK